MMNCFGMRFLTLILMCAMCVTPVGSKNLDLKKSSLNRHMRGLFSLFDNIDVHQTDTEVTGDCSRFVSFVASVSIVTSSSDGGPSLEDTTLDHLEQAVLPSLGLNGSSSISSRPNGVAITSIRISADGFTVFYSMTVRMNITSPSYSLPFTNFNLFSTSYSIPTCPSSSCWTTCQDAYNRLIASQSSSRAISINTVRIGNNRIVNSKSDCTVETVVPTTLPTVGPHTSDTFAVNVSVIVIVCLIIVFSPISLFILYLKFTKKWIFREVSDPLRPTRTFVADAMIISTETNSLPNSVTATNLSPAGDVVDLDVSPVVIGTSGVMLMSSNDSFVFEGRPILEKTMSGNVRFFLRRMSSKISIQSDSSASPIATPVSSTMPSRDPSPTRLPLSREQSRSRDISPPSSPPRSSSPSRTRPGSPIRMNSTNSVSSSSSRSQQLLAAMRISEQHALQLSAALSSTAFDFFPHSELSDEVQNDANSEAEGNLEGHVEAESSDDDSLEGLSTFRRTSNDGRSNSLDYALRMHPDVTAEDVDSAATVRAPMSALYSMFPPNVQLDYRSMGLDWSDHSA